MADLNTDVRFIKGIGEKKALSLQKLGVRTLYDLVSFFPRAYEDRTQFKPIALLMPDETACVRLPKDKGFSLIVHPGGHHFNDDYAPLALDILNRIATQPAAAGPAT